MLHNFVEKIKTQFSGSQLFSKILPFKTLWKNTVQPGRQQLAIWRTSIAWWVPITTNTHS